MPSRKSGGWLFAFLAGGAMLLPSFPAAAGAATFDANVASLGPIPDGGPGTSVCPDFGAPRDVTFEVTGLAAPITDVQVTLALSPLHTAIGDLDVQLLAPGGAPAHTIFSRTGATSDTLGASACLGDNSNVIGTYTFTDGAAPAPSWWSAAAAGDGNYLIPNGFYRASAPGGPGSTGANTLITPTFSPMANPNGTWTLRFRDALSGDTTAVTSATLGITASAAPPPPPVVDADPPETLILKKPRKRSGDRTPSFRFDADEDGSSFQCTLDQKKVFEDCGDRPTFDVKPGKHKLLVAAIDAAGNVDPTPVKIKFRVRR